MEVWEVSSGECIQSLETPYERLAVAWNSDGTRICGAGWERDSDCIVIYSIRVWEVSSGQCIQILPLQSEVLSFRWSRDETISIQLSNGRESTNVQVWEITSGRCETRKLDLHGHYRKVSWSSDCSKFCYQRGDNIEVCNVKSGKIICTLGNGGLGVAAISWSRDDTRLYSGNVSGTIQVWEVPSGQCIQTFGCLDDVLSLSLNRDGRICSVSSRAVRVWDLSYALSSVGTPQLERHSDRVTALFWSTGGRVCSLSKDHTAQVWEVSNGRHVQTLHFSSPNTSVSWSNDNTKVCGAGSWDMGSGCGQALQVDVKEVSSGFSIQSLPQKLDNYHPVDCHVSWSPDNNKICCGAEAIMQVWEVSSGRLLQTFKGYSYVTSTSWSSDGRRICSGDYCDNKVCIWDLCSGRCIQTLEGQGLDRVTSVSWSGDGSRICGGDNSTVLVWEVESGRCIRVHERPESPWYDETPLPWFERVFLRLNPEMTRGSTPDKMTLSWSPDCS